MPNRGFSFRLLAVPALIVCSLGFLWSSHWDGASSSTWASSLQYDGTVATSRLSSQSKPGRPMKIYVYELPKNMTDDILEMPYLKGWLMATGHEFEADSLFHELIVDSAYRTFDPEEATLFYVPALTTRMGHVYEGFDNKTYDQAFRESGLYFRDALDIIKRQPYWSRMNGRDHFTVVTDDRARCAHYEHALDPSVWGEMFFLQHQGDLTSSSHYDWGLANFACYNPDKDVLLPLSLRRGVDPTDTIPLPEQRDIKVLYPFVGAGLTASQPYFGISLRRELLADLENDPLPGAVQMAASIETTVANMGRAVFCICPPGLVPHTSRFYRAIVRGCIPVTFFRAFHLPYQDIGLDYSAFSINVQPTDYKLLKVTLERVMRDGERVRAMQKRLEEVRDWFLWGGDRRGAGPMVLKQLQLRSDQVDALRPMYLSTLRLE